MSGPPLCPGVHLGLVLLVNEDQGDVVGCKAEEGVSVLDFLPTLGAEDDTP